MNASVPVESYFALLFGDDHHVSSPLFRWYNSETEPFVPGSIPCNIGLSAEHDGSFTIAAGDRYDFIHKSRTDTPALRVRVHGDLSDTQFVTRTGEEHPTLDVSVKLSNEYPPCLNSVLGGSIRDHTRGQELRVAGSFELLLRCYVDFAAPGDIVECTVSNAE